jgi:hypothetical protein
LVLFPPRQKRDVQLAKIALGIIFLLTFLRAITWSERLAIFEVAVPMVTAYALTARAYPKSVLLSSMLRAGPYAGVAALLIIFGVFEAARSWSHYAPIYNNNMAIFVLDRVALYYGTALNNGAAINQYIPSQPLKFFVSLDWLYHIPFISTFFSTGEYRAYSQAYMSLLANRLNPEFNNPSGLFSYMWDFGFIIAVPVFCLCGVFAGYAYKHARAHRVGALCFYPVILLGFSELLRIPVLTNGRMIYTYLGLAAVIVAASQKGMHRRNVGQSGPGFAVIPQSTTGPNADS